MLGSAPTKISVGVNIASSVGGSELAFDRIEGGAGNAGSEGVVVGPSAFAYLHDLDVDCGTGQVFETALEIDATVSMSKAGGNPMERLRVNLDAPPAGLRVGIHIGPSTPSTNGFEIYDSAVSGGTTSNVNSATRAISSANAPMHVYASRIFGGTGGSTSMAMQVAATPGSTTIDVESSIVSGGGGTTSTAIAGNSVKLILLQDTLDAGSGTTSTAVSFTGNEATFEAWNTLFVARSERTRHRRRRLQSLALVRAQRLRRLPRALALDDVVHDRRHQRPRPRSLLERRVLRERCGRGRDGPKRVRRRRLACDVRPSRGLPVVDGGAVDRVPRCGGEGRDRERAHDRRVDARRRLFVRDCEGGRAEERRRQRRPRRVFDSATPSIGAYSHPACSK